MGGWQAAGTRAAGPDPRQADLGHGHRGPALIAYVDTSALLKVFVEEDGSAIVREHLARASRLATSALTYVEAHTALARRRHARDLTPVAHDAAVRAFNDGWERYYRLDVSEAVLGEAARLGARHGLRAYDAVHLASAVVLRARLGVEMTLSSWDDELDRAAAREGFQLLRPPR